MLIQLLSFTSYWTRIPSYWTTLRRVQVYWSTFTWKVLSYQTMLTSAIWASRSHSCFTDLMKIRDLRISALSRRPSRSSKNRTPGTCGKNCRWSVLQISKIILGSADVAALVHFDRTTTRQALCVALRMTLVRSCRARIHRASPAPRASSPSNLKNQNQLQQCLVATFPLMEHMIDHQKQNFLQKEEILKNLLILFLTL